MKKNFYILRYYRDGEVVFATSLTKNQAEVYELNGFRDQENGFQLNIVGGVTHNYRMDLK